DEMGADGIAAIGRKRPTRSHVVPDHAIDRGPKHRLVVKTIFAADLLRIIEDLAAGRIFLARHAPQFFEQRDIDVGFDVAMHAGIAVPIPGTPEIAGPIDEYDVVDTGLLQT